MAFQQTRTWLRDALRAYTGDEVSLPVLILGLVALVAALVIAGITIGTYLVFIIVGLLVFVALYVGYQALRALYRRLRG